MHDGETRLCNFFFLTKSFVRKNNYNYRRRSSFMIFNIIGRNIKTVQNALNRKKENGNGRPTFFSKTTSKTQVFVKLRQCRK